MVRFNQIAENMKGDLSKYSYKFLKESFLNEAKSLGKVKKQLWRTKLTTEQFKNAVKNNEESFRLKIKNNSYKDEATHINEIYSKKEIALLKKYQKTETKDIKQQLEEKGIFNSDNEGKLIILTDNNGNEHYLTLNANFIKKIKDYLSKGFFETDILNAMGFGSDVDIVQHVFNYGIQNIEIEENDEIIPKKKHDGGDFFKYYCKMDIDLSRYGILKDFDEIYYLDSCIIHALRLGGLAEIKIDELKLLMKSTHMTQKDLKDVCKDLNICVIVHKKRLNKGKEETMKIKYGEGEEIYNIGLHDEHYFIMEKTNITSYAVEHYDEIKHIKDWNKIRNSDFLKCNDRFIDSLNLFNLLIKNKDVLLEEIKMDDKIMSTPYYNDVNQVIKSLEYGESAYKKFEDQEIIEKDYTLVYFDFETVTKTTDDIHIPYMVCYQIEGLDIQTIIGNEKIGLSLLHRLYTECKDDNICLVAHNMRYDISFISKYLHTIYPTEAGNKIIACSGMYKNKKIMVKDSYSIISMPLRKFPECFNINDTKKELINYNMYNELIPEFWKSGKKEYNMHEIADKYYNDSKNEFYENCRRWNLKNGANIDIIKYAKKYCEQDIYILNKGYSKFREWVIELYKIDIKNIMTISGLADKVLKKNGCYDGCYSLGGIIRKFISQCVVGGRTMTRKNKKIMKGNFDKLIEKVNSKDFTKEEEIEMIKKYLIYEINDFDGVSLYPSAMARINGFLKGLPKVFNNLSFEELQNKDYYYVEIKIKKIGIKRNFPLISKLNEDGVRIFNNNMEEEIIVVDKVTLEDLIEFQKVEFEIIRGYYFDEGFNTNINTLIVNMFNARVEKKKEKNPIEIVYKLLMNSAYGKTILKEQEFEKKYFNNIIEGKKYMLRNYTKVIEGRLLTNDNKFMVKTIKEINNHFNYCHIGSYILSMSKRIMNEVICTAEDNEIDIYYQDTDSMHIKDEDIEKLRSIYNVKYNRELIGKNLGQFHSDFNMSNKDAKNIKAIGSIFLGKKCYLDVLKADNLDELDLHIRNKGVSEASVKYTANKNYNHKTEIMKVINLYYDLFMGDEVEFDLLCDGDEIKFKTFDLIVKSVTEFKRIIQY